ncbi:MAG: hypothetical protein LBO66_01765 [Deltaproteobacteria bacterium]|jgi:hypothetical protein|nr:hypothetical protein [Deltaproteobacteria bacterium]
MVKAFFENLREKPGWLYLSFELDAGEERPLSLSANARRYLVSFKERVSERFLQPQDSLQEWSNAEFFFPLQTVSLDDSYLVLEIPPDITVKLLQNNLYSLTVKDQTIVFSDVKIQASQISQGTFPQYLLSRAEERARAPDAFPASPAPVEGRPPAPEAGAGEDAGAPLSPLTWTSKRRFAGTGKRPSERAPEIGVPAPSAPAPLPRAEASLEERASALEAPPAPSLPPRASRAPWAKLSLGLLLLIAVALAGLYAARSYWGPGESAAPLGPPGEPLALGPDIGEGDVSFLEGCWEADGGIVNLATNLRVDLAYCFDARGQGTLRVRELNPDLSLHDSCAARASAEAWGGALVISDEGAVCSQNPASHYARHVVTCGVAAGGGSECSVKSGGSQYGVVLTRAPWGEF